jgi:hypothetical protein
VIAAAAVVDARGTAELAHPDDQGLVDRSVRSVDIARSSCGKAIVLTSLARCGVCESQPPIVGE